MKGEGVGVVRDRCRPSLNNFSCFFPAPTTRPTRKLLALELLVYRRPETSGRFVPPHPLHSFPSARLCFAAGMPENPCSNPRGPLVLASEDPDELAPMEPPRRPTYADLTRIAAERVCARLELFEQCPTLRSLKTKAEELEDSLSELEKQLLDVAHQVVALQEADNQRAIQERGLEREILRHTARLEAYRIELDAYRRSIDQHRLLVLLVIFIAIFLSYFF